MPKDAAFYVELKSQPENGDVYVSSPQVAGLHLIGKCFQDMKADLERALVRLFKDNQGANVKVIWLTDTAATATMVDDVLTRLAIVPDEALAA